ncbi:histone acetyltransferase 1 [Nowakowskiella sp. JEL0078]|nr:histone acetyltransferase 1 [Nowakowskiella sp. JEL0078]
MASSVDMMETDGEERHGDYFRSFCTPSSPVSYIDTFEFWTGNETLESPAFTPSFSQPRGLVRVDSMCDSFSELSVVRPPVKRPSLHRSKSALVIPVGTKVQERQLDQTQEKKNNYRSTNSATRPAAPTITQHYPRKKNSHESLSAGKIKTVSRRRSVEYDSPTRISIESRNLTLRASEHIERTPRSKVSNNTNREEFPRETFRTPPQQQHRREQIHESRDKTRNRFVTLKSSRYAVSPESLQILTGYYKGGKSKMTNYNQGRPEDNSSHMQDSLEVINKSELPEYLCDSNAALTISLVSPFETLEFNPLLTWNLYGKDELIYGYKNLKLSVGAQYFFSHFPKVQKLSYTSGSLFAYLKSDYTKRITDAVDVLSPLVDHLVPGAFTDNYDNFKAQVEKDSDTFKPLGEKFYEYNRLVKNEDVTYELYLCTFQTPGFLKYHQRLQLFLLWFIDGVQYLNVDEPWEIIVGYEKRMRGSTPVYSVFGYSTFYSFLYFPDKKRARISQFLIFPPYQKKGHAGMMYNALVDILYNRIEVAEIVVEQPNDDFMDMRDKCDMERLLKDSFFKDLIAPISNDVIEKIRQKYKLSKSQAERLVEMSLLRNCKTNDAKLYKAYRIQVKARLYRRNFASLQHTTREEKVAELQKSFKDLESDYRAVLCRLSE